MSANKIIEKNNKIFAEVRKLEFPLGHYAITSSGPLGISGLRLIGDADLVVDDYLWKELSKKHNPIIEDGSPKKIVLANGLVEVLHEGSFYYNYQPEDPSIDEQIETADVIDGLPFVSLKYIKYFKQKIGRDKDKKDVVLIDKFLEL